MDKQTSQVYTLPIQYSNSSCPQTQWNLPFSSRPQNQYSQTPVLCSLTFPLLLLISQSWTSKIPPSLFLYTQLLSRPICIYVDRPRHPPILAAHLDSATTGFSGAVFTFKQAPATDLIAINLKLCTLLQYSCYGYIT